MRLSLRNDLYCVGWGVKLYSLTRVQLHVTVSIQQNIVTYMLYVKKREIHNVVASLLKFSVTSVTHPNHRRIFKVRAPQMNRC